MKLSTPSVNQRFVLLAAGLLLGIGFANATLGTDSRPARADAPGVVAPAGEGVADTEFDQLLERYRHMAPVRPLHEGPTVGELEVPLAGTNAALTLQTMPGSDFGLTPPQLRLFTWTGRNLILWGRISGGSAPYTATWDPGDGSGPQAANVSNPNYVYLQHTYSTFGPQFAVLHVTDGGGNSASATVRIEVDNSPPGQQTRVNAAIEDGLRYLYLHQNPDGSWSDYYQYGTPTGLALAGFELAGHLPTNAPAGDVYADRVRLGLERMIGTLVTQGISAQAAGNPDTALPDGLGVRHSDGVGAYTQGIIMLALSLSRDPTAVATQGPLTGWTYKNVLADMVDQLAWSQAESPSYRGGWRYTVAAADQDADNSAVQWASIGLASAQIPPWSIQAAPFVKPELLRWLAASQCADGGFGYTAANSWCNGAKTGSGLFSLLYAGTLVSDARVQNGLTFLNNHWCDGGDTSGYREIFNGNFYGLYAVKKALEDFAVQTVGVHDWRDEMHRYLVKDLPVVCGRSWWQFTDNGQPLTDGYWNDGTWVAGYYNESTAFALLILIPGVVCAPPSAVAVATPSSACPDQQICFDGSGSSSSVGGQIEEWLWDYNCDGSIDAQGPQVCAPSGTFPLPPNQTSQTYNVCLTVVDRSVAAGACSLGTKLIPIVIGTENHPPIPITGGPYTACLCDTIRLNGCASFDPDVVCTGDSITEYLWDLNSDNVTDFVSHTCVPDTFLVFCDETERQIQLRVRDRFGLISEPQLGKVSVWSSRRELSIAAGDLQFTRFGCDSLRVTATIHAHTQEPGVIIGATTAVISFDDPTCVIPANRICEVATPPLLDGATFSFSCMWRLPDAGTHTIYVCVDPSQAVHECNETDNIAGRETGCPSSEMIALNDVKQTSGVDQLLRIPDPGTGVASLIGSLGNHFQDSEALAVEPSTGRIYVVDNNRLLLLDGFTGIGIEIGPVGFSDVDGLAFHPQTGVLYGVTYGSNKIIRIDTTTGHGTVVANHVLEGHRLNDLAFHPDGRAFIIVDGTPRVYLVDIATGANLHRWTLTGGTSLEALVWSPDGSTLFSAADRGAFKDLVTIDLTTSTITFVSAAPSGYKDIEGLAFTSTGRTSLAERWGMPVAVGALSPSKFHLYQNAPNPFNPRTVIAYELPAADDVDLTVYDVSGREVIKLVHGHQPAGRHDVAWAGTTAGGTPVATGIYYYTLRGTRSTETRRMVLVK